MHQHSGVSGKIVTPAKRKTTCLASKSMCQVLFAVCGLYLQYPKRRGFDLTIHVPSTQKRKRTLGSSQAGIVSCTFRYVSCMVQDWNLSSLPCCSHNVGQELLSRDAKKPFVWGSHCRVLSILLHERNNAHWHCAKKNQVTMGSVDKKL